MRNDIKLAAKVITNLDTRWQLWNFGENNEKNENQEQVEDSLEKIIYKEQKLLIYKVSPKIFFKMICIPGSKK